VVRQKPRKIKFLIASRDGISDVAGLDRAEDKQGKNRLRNAQLNTDVTKRSLLLFDLSLQKIDTAVCFARAPTSIDLHRKRHETRGRQAAAFSNSE
jgi:hypothetical protein